jgi:hypothetical protein
VLVAFAALIVMLTGFVVVAIDEAVTLFTCCVTSVAFDINTAVGCAVDEKVPLFIAPGVLAIEEFNVTFVDIKLVEVLLVVVLP